MKILESVKGKKTIMSATLLIIYALAKMMGVEFSPELDTAVLTMLGGLTAVFMRQGIKADGNKNV